MSFQGQIFVDQKHQDDITERKSKVKLFQVGVEKTISQKSHTKYVDVCVTQGSWKWKSTSSSENSGYTPEN